jgi:hypothetical protein
MVARLDGPDPTDWIFFIPIIVKILSIFPTSWTLGPCFDLRRRRFAMK